MLNLQEITEVYNEMFDIKWVGTFIVAGKILGSAIIGFSLYARIFKNFGRFEQLLVKDKEDTSLPYTLIRGLILIGLISLSTEIFTMADKLFTAIENEFVTEYVESFDLMEFATDPYEEQREEEETEMSIFNMEKLLSIIAGKVSKVMSGSWLIGGIFSLILYLVDGIIYGIFLSERFFILGLLKLFAPIILALSIFEKFRDFLYNLAKVALRWYLVIIPFFGVNIFCSMIIRNMPEAMERIAGEAGGEILFNATRTVFYLFLIIIKFKLYTRSKNVMKEIIQ